MEGKKIKGEPKKDEAFWLPPDENRQARKEEQEIVEDIPG